MGILVLILIFWFELTFQTEKLDGSNFLNDQIWLNILNGGHYDKNSSKIIILLKFNKEQNDRWLSKSLDFSVNYYWWIKIDIFSVNKKWS